MNLETVRTVVDVDDWRMFQRWAAANGFPGNTAGAFRALLERAEVKPPPLMTVACGWCGCKWPCADPDHRNSPAVARLAS